MKNATASGRRVTTPASSSVSSDLEPGENAERAVVASAGLDGVDVASHHYRSAVVETAPDAHDIADRVDRDREAEFAHPADDEVTALPIGFGEGETVDPAVRPRARFGQPFEARGQSRAIHSKIVSHGERLPRPMRRRGRETDGGRGLAATMKHLWRDCVQTQLMVLLSQAALTFERAIRGDDLPVGRARLSAP